jgi:hypothetical protein
MIKKLLLPLILLTTLQLRGQTPARPAMTFNDFIELKNGSRLYCHVKSYIVNELVVFVMEDGTEQRLMASQVKRVVMQPRDNQRLTHYEKPYEFKEKGVFNATNLTIGFGKDYNFGDPQLLTGIQHTVGWQFNRLIGAGIGFSYDNYVIIDGDAPTWAVYGEARGYFNRKNKSLFYTLAAGYGKLLKTSENQQFMDARYGGYMLQPTVGYRFGGSKGLNFVMDIGTRFQRVGYEDNNQASLNNYKITYQRAVLRLGVIF